jgi:hypothetical protein
VDLASLKWSAVAACCVFSVVSGAIWFGPKTFFPTWWAAIGKRTDDHAVGTPLTWILLLLTSIAQAIGSAIVIPILANAMGGTNVMTGATAGLLIWFSFVGATGLANKLFAGHLKAWAIESGNHLLNFVAFGAIIGALR